MYTPVAADVAKLRNTTGAGMMDCKKAFTEAEGDFEKAIEILRKKGQKVAANRADRESTEGAVIAKVNEDHTLGVVIALNCETDFVAKNAAFVELAHELAEQALFYKDKEEFLASDFHGISVAEKLIEQTGVIGEKIEIGAFERLDGTFVGSYIIYNFLISANRKMLFDVVNIRVVRWKHHLQCPILQVRLFPILVLLPLGEVAPN
jgi:elongation factor Ts